MPKDKQAAIAVTEHDQTYGVKKVSPFLDDGNGNLVRQTVSGFNIPPYDYIGIASDSTTDAYTFKAGGASGETVATITFTYSDASKETLTSISKT